MEEKDRTQALKIVAELKKAMGLSERERFEKYGSMGLVLLFARLEELLGE